MSRRESAITVLIAHRLSTVMHADVIHVLEKGVIIESGSHAELLAQKGLYYAMWRQQIGERTRGGCSPSQPPVHSSQFSVDSRVRELPDSLTLTRRRGWGP